MNDYNNSTHKDLGGRICPVDVDVTNNRIIYNIVPHVRKLPRITKPKLKVVA